MTSNQRFWLILLLSALGIVFFSLGIYSLKTILVPFFAGFIGAYGFHRLIHKLEKWHLNRTFASALVVLTILCIIFGLTLIALPYFQQQLVKLATSIPELAGRLLDMASPLLENFFQKNHHQVEELERQLTSHIGDFLKFGLQFFINLISGGTMIANLLSWILLTPLVMFYLLKDWPILLQKTQELIPSSHHASLIAITKEIDQRLSAYAWGQVQVCLLLATLYAIGLNFIGLKQGIFVGLITGILAFIPYVGMLIGLLASTGLALAQTGNFTLVPSVFIIFFIISMIEANLLTPRFIGQKIGLHPLWILLALLASGTWFGFIGLVLTLPVAALTGVLVRVLIRHYHQSAFFQGK